MTPIDKLTSWLADNPPKDMPYWPGARVTTPFGMRSQKTVLAMGASLFHLGVDRAGGGDYIMPFDGFIEWHPVKGSPGSILRIVPDLLRLEIQVFHTEAPKYLSSIEQRMYQGEPMPVKPGALGMSTGVHTHTEVLLPYDESLMALFAGGELLVNKRQVDLAMVEKHCAMCDIEADQMMVKAIGQVRTWEIEEMGEHYAIRRSLPGYRVPAWGPGVTLHVDSMALLQI